MTIFLYFSTISNTKKIIGGEIKNGACKSIQKVGWNTRKGTQKKQPLNVITE